MKPKHNWRDEMESTPVYTRKFAIWPKKLNDGTTVWMKPYYKKFLIYSSAVMPGVESHIDYVECISEELFVVRKLSENY